MVKDKDNNNNNNNNSSNSQVFGRWPQTKNLVAVVKLTLGPPLSTPFQHTVRFLGVSWQNLNHELQRLHLRSHLSHSKLHFISGKMSLLSFEVHVHVRVQVRVHDHLDVRRIALNCLLRLGCQNYKSFSFVDSDMKDRDFSIKRFELRPAGSKE